MRKSIDRLLGQRWSGIVRGSWKWWRERPLARGGTAAVKVAAEAYRSMQAQVRQLARTVRDQELACDRAERIYLAKVREYCRCQQALDLARQQRHEGHVQAVMYRAQRLERLLPQLKDNVERGDRYLQVARQTLQQEQDRLETYRYQLHELYCRDRANQTLTTLLQMTSPHGETARERFERAKTAIEDRQQYAQALYDLSDAAMLGSGRPESLLGEPGESRPFVSTPPDTATSPDAATPPQPVLLPKPQFLPPLQRPQRSR